jgi:hypothetical protein
MPDGETVLGIINDFGSWRKSGVKNRPETCLIVERPTSVFTCPDQPFSRIIRIARQGRTGSNSDIFDCLPGSALGKLNRFRFHNWKRRDRLNHCVPRILIPLGRRFALKIVFR